MKYTVEIKDRLKQARLEAGLTQAELAEKAGINLKTIMNSEQGRAKPNLDTLLVLCDFYDCDLDFLTGRIDHKTHDAAFVCEYTGLSERAVSRLHAWNKKAWAGIGLSQFLSVLVENTAFSTVLSRIQKYLVPPTRQTVEPDPDAHVIHIYTGLPSADDLNLCGLPSADDLNLWSASHAFTTCLESIKKKYQN